MEECLQEEKKYEFDIFCAETAWQIGKAGVMYAKEKGLSVCVDIFAYSRQLFHYCSDGCTVSNEEFLRKKRNAVLYFGHSTRFLHIKNKSDTSLLQTKYGLELRDYCITMGGFPIRIKNSGIAGAICVSGLAPQEDHDFIIHLLEEYFQGNI